MRKNTRRRQKESFNPQPTPDHHNRQFPYGNTSRDSDASFASSRPSLVGVGRSSVAPLDAYTDRSQQGAAVRSINSYLNSHSSLLTLRTHPISSSKEIIETLQFLIHQLDYPVSKIEDELFSILKILNCPFKVNKSALRAPNTPHNFPSFLALIHWLVQIATCKEHLAENSNSFLEHSSILVYSSDSYLNYIRGDDESVEALDREFIEKLENDRNGVSESVNVLRTTVDELAAKAEALKSRPTEREKLEKEKGVLKEDVTKFHAIIEEFNQSIKARLKVLEEKSNALQTKVEEKKRIDVENEELKKQVENQSFNARDAERMKRELQAVERDIGESETARNVCEEKIWDLDSTIAHKLKELEALSMSCNQEAKRLKFDNIVQFALNAKGSTPAEVLGIDYKSTIKPKLGSFADDIKQRSVSNLEEVTLLQKQSSQLISKIDSKRIRFSQIQSHIDEVSASYSELQTVPKIDQHVFC
ncbi:Kinetochore protein NDC80 homolog [Linum perenne]